MASSRRSGRKLKPVRKETKKEKHSEEQVQDHSDGQGTATKKKQLSSRSNVTPRKDRRQEELLGRWVDQDPHVKIN